MPDVLVYERTSAAFSAGLAERGHHIVYRINEPNRCPGCGRSQWYIGRVSAECGFCETAVPLAEARYDGGGSRAPRSKSPIRSGEQRRHDRMPGHGRKLQLLIDGSPKAFALHNISEGGVMGAAHLALGSRVHVRFEGGVIVPAVVKWCKDGLVGLAFTAPVVLDRSWQSAN